MGSIRDIEFLARPVRDGFSLRQRFIRNRESDPDGVEWATLRYDVGQGWIAVATHKPFQDRLSNFLSRVRFAEYGTALKAARCAYEVYFHGEEVDDGPLETMYELEGRY